MSETHDPTLDDIQNPDLAPNRPEPPVTAEMKQAVRDLLGADILSRRRDLNPDTNLVAYWANKKPAYSLGGLTFDVYEGEETWENAWAQMLVQLRQMKTANIIR